MGPSPRLSSFQLRSSLKEAGRALASPIVGVEAGLISPFQSQNQNSPGISGLSLGPLPVPSPVPPGQALKSAFYELFHFPNGGVFVLLSHLTFFFFYELQS